jgi:hypothetical protein
MKQKLSMKRGAKQEPKVSRVNNENHKTHPEFDTCKVNEEQIPLDCTHGKSSPVLFL